MNMDFLISRAGIRVAKLTIDVSGLRLVRGSTSFGAQSADAVTGAMTFSLADLTAALARPEVIDQVFAGISGLARPEFVLRDGDHGGVKITGSVEVVGRRFPITAATRIRVDNNRIVVSMAHLEGIPLIGMLSSRLPEFVLPLSLPVGLHFTDVTTEPGAIVVHFAGEDVWLSEDPRPEVPEPPPPAAKDPD